MKMRDSKGFTLIELLIVVAIIASSRRSGSGSPARRMAGTRRGHRITARDQQRPGELLVELRPAGMP